MEQSDVRIGEVVVWEGAQPAIATVKGTCKTFKGSYILHHKTHNSCDHSNLRPPTLSELQRLLDSKKDFILL